MIEIDGVRRALEDPITEAGDYISDEYERMLDLATSPLNTTELGSRRLASSIRRLNRNLGTTSTILVGGECEEVYDSVVEQVNDICVELAVGSLEKLIKDDSRYGQYSGSYKFAD